MTATARHRVTGTPLVSAQWLATVLVAASLVELMILRVGTRTAIHIPGLEEIAGPYRVFAATGRLAFFAAVVLLAVLLPYLARELLVARQSHAAATLSIFVIFAGLGALRVIGSNVMAPAVTAIIASLAVVVLGRERRPLNVVVGLFILAYLAHASYGILQSSFGVEATRSFRRVPLAAELVAVLAAAASGPLMRRALGLAVAPSRRMMWASFVVGVVVTGAIVANPSTVHILMLWNFGLTGSLPAAAYGFAAASLTVAIASSLRAGRQQLALALTLLFLGGMGLTSTYQSGLVVAGLGLLGLAVGRDNRSVDVAGSAARR